MAKKADKDIKETIVSKALELAQELGWAQVRLADVADRAGVSLPELFDIVDDKTDILVLFGKMVDRRVLEAIGEPDPEISARDQLFDILMERFEILNDYRPGLLAILESFKFDPKQAVISAPYLCRSMSWMLELAGIDTGGVRGAVKVAGLTGVYLKTLKVWKEDESTDLAKVMSALDKDLGRVEQFANTLGF
ncbi:MAG: TetR family transcriptional regulator [Pseudomonadota bacterium]